MSDHPAPDGDPQRLAEELRTLVRNLSARLRVESAQVTTLSLPQQSVLVCLDLEPGRTSAELARAGFVRPQSMNTTVASLRHLGLVQAASSPDDARRKVLSLTNAGREELQRIRESRHDWLQERLSGSMSASEREELARAVLLLRDLANTPVDPVPRTP